MIAIDTSALIAIALNEPEAQSCIEVMAGDADLIISAGTLFETLMVARNRNVGLQMKAFFDTIDLTVVAIDGGFAERAAEAHGRWGRSAHKAKLNFGDCFAYTVARDHDCPLLFIGNDFAMTDIRPARPI